MTLSRRLYSVNGPSQGFSSSTLVGFTSKELIASPIGMPRDFACSEREYERGVEIVWYADGDKTVRNEYNPTTAYAFDKVFGPHTNSQEVYDVAAKPVVRAMSLFLS